MLLVESQCCPPISLFHEAKKHGSILIEKHENYQKRSFRNRIYLNSSQGRSLFTIPLKKGKNEKQLITQVRIAYDVNWIEQIFRFFQSNYGSAPFYEHYIDDIMMVFSKEHEYLYDLNFEMLNTINKKLKINLRIIETNVYQTGPNEEIIDIRDQIRPTLEYFTSQVQWRYAQVYEEKNSFIPHLSILDMLFCCGPETASIL